MSNVLIVVSKENYSSNKTILAIELAEKIQKKGKTTTLFLVEDGVYFSRDKKVDDVINLGITVKVEKWDLKARGLDGKINTKVIVSDIEDLFAEISEKSDKALWF